MKCMHDFFFAPKEQWILATVRAKRKPWLDRKKTAPEVPRNAKAPSSLRDDFLFHHSHEFRCAPLVARALCSFGAENPFSMPRFQVIDYSIAYGKLF